MKTYKFTLSTGSVVRVEAATQAEAERMMWAGLYGALDPAVVATVTIESVEVE